LGNFGRIKKKNNLLPEADPFLINFKQRKKIKILISGDPGVEEIIFVIGRIDAEKGEILEKIKIRKKFILHCLQSKKFILKGKRFSRSINSKFEKEKYHNRQRCHERIWRHFKFIVFQALKKLFPDSVIENLNVKNILLSIGGWKPEKRNHFAGHWLSVLKNTLYQKLPHFYEIDEEYTSRVSPCCGIATNGNIIAINNYFEIGNSQIYKIVCCSNCSRIYHRDVAGSINIFHKTQQFFKYNESMYPSLKSKEKKSFSKNMCSIRKYLPPGTTLK